MLSLVGRSSGLMVSAMDSGSRGAGCSMSWAKQFTLTVPIYTQGVGMGTGEFSGKPDEIQGG